MRVLAHSLAALSAVAAAPFFAAALAFNPRWRVGWRERLGDFEPCEAGRVWVHGASVGEALAALRLIECLRERGYPIFASATTPTGRALLRRALPEVPSTLAPIDHPWCVEAALTRVRPSLLALVETELWPAWIAAADRHRIPVVVVSGRVSDRSLPRYRRLRWLLGSALRRLDAVGARTELDAQRFVELGVPADRVRVTGDLKLETPGGVSRLAADLERALGPSRFFVAGSTHPGEERAALQALAQCEREGIATAMVVAPRHPGRADAVERELRVAGRKVRRRSALGVGPLAPGEVLLLDSLGELPAVYSAATVAFVGGTLAPLGGHNILEPVLAGCPVVFGPQIANVRSAAEIVERSGAGVQIDSAAGLAFAIAEALRDPEKSRSRGARGRETLDDHRGSAERSAELIAGMLALGSTRTRG